MAMNTQSINHHHYSPLIGQEVLQAPVSTDSGTEYIQLAWSAPVPLWFVPGIPRDHKPKHGLLRRSFTRVRSAQTRPEGQGVEFSSRSIRCLSVPRLSEEEMSHLIRTLTLSHCAFLAFLPQTRDQIVTCSAIPWLFPYLYLGIPWRLPDYPQNHHPLSCSLQSITIHPEISSLLTLQKKKLSPLENYPPICRMDNQFLKPALDNFPP